MNSTTLLHLPGVAAGARRRRRKLTRGQVLLVVAVVGGCALLAGAGGMVAGPRDHLAGAVGALVGWAGSGIGLMRRMFDTPAGRWFAFMCGGMGVIVAESICRRAATGVPAEHGIRRRLTNFDPVRPLLSLGSAMLWLSSAASVAVAVLGWAGALAPSH